MPANIFLRKFLLINKKKFGLIFIFLIIILLIVIILKNDQLFLIRDIKIICKNCSKENLIGLELIKTKNFLSLIIKKKEIEEKLKLINPEVKTVTLEIFSFSSAKLTVLKYQILAVLEQEDYYFYLSEDGRIIKKSTEKENDLPKIFYYQNLPTFYYKTGEWIDYSDIKFTLSAIFLLKNELNYQVEKAEIKSEEMIIFNLSDSKTIFLSAKKNIGQQKYELTEILKRFKIKGRDFKTIDLRFNKPVVVFN